MVSDKRISSEIEPELYALVNTINELNKRYKQGTINDNFYRKATKNAMQGIFRITIFLKKADISLNELLKKMDFVREYNQAMAIVDLVNVNNGTPSPEEVEVQNAFLELPRLTSSITSDFITLMDALKLGSLQNGDLYLKLFQEVLSNTHRIRGLESIHTKTEKIYQHASKNLTSLVENEKYREKIGEHLYSIFQEFEEKINVN